MFNLDPLIAAATAQDGQPPFSDQSLVDARQGARQVLTREGSDDNLVAAAIVRGSGTREAEVVVHPDARRAGLGGSLVAQILAEGDTVFWAHGDHPGARALAARHHLHAVRTLLQMRATVDTAPEPRPNVRVSSFRPGVDDADWLRLNAAAFADHPEQGSLTAHDLAARITEPWFDDDDFLLLYDPSGTLVAFAWLKVEDALGEFYAVGVDPERQGEGFGRAAVEAGLRRLHQLRITESSLYVEADNIPAVALYRSYGFEQHSIDVQYARI